MTRHILTTWSDTMAVSYAWQPAPYRPARPWGRIIAVGVAIGVVVSAAVVAVAVLVSQPSTPEPISGAELMAEYHKLSPYDASANVSNMATLASQYCGQLDDGTSARELTGRAEVTWPMRGVEVVRLFVAYGCPEHLKDMEGLK